MKKKRVKKESGCGGDGGCKGVWRGKWGPLVAGVKKVVVGRRRYGGVMVVDDDTPPAPDDESSSSSSTVADWDDFNESSATSDDDLDPGSWRPIFEPNDNDVDVIDDFNASYYKSVGDMIDAVSGGAKSMEDVVKEIDEARGGHALSLLGFCYGLGIGKERNSAKAF
nr:ERAD-associated E3 ubiquitin-protein ligase component HRD3A-like [Tanacetum cinerariifolium]